MGRRFVALVSRVCCVAAVALLGVVSPAFATGGATVPDVGVNLVSYITAFGTNLGTYIVVVVGLYFAYLAIRIGLKWSRRAA